MPSVLPLHPLRPGGGPRTRQQPHPSSENLYSTQNSRSIKLRRTYMYTYPTGSTVLIKWVKIDQLHCKRHYTLMYNLKLPVPNKHVSFFNGEISVADLDITKGWFLKSKRARRVSNQPRAARNFRVTPTSGPISSPFVPSAALAYCVIQLTMQFLQRDQLRKK